MPNFIGIKRAVFAMENQVDYVRFVKSVNVVMVLCVFDDRAASSFIFTRGP